MAHIKTFARLKPPKKPNENFSVANNVLTIQVPDGKDSLQMVGTPLNRSSATYDVSFDNVFGSDTTQQDVFDNVAKDIIQNFLTGFNGTIFAYGQTGTGKTYTVEGNSCRYQSRGLATRALSMIYEELEKRTDEHISVYLSFLEIYQEVAYDLLNPAARTMLPVLPFSKVTVVEGPNGSCILRGLSVHLAANEDVAQMLLLQGQANRRVAETTVNQRSSRSHAVFSVYLQSRKKDSQIILNSKLHLVDLAGSERVSKTGVDGQQLTEAKSINLSLHHLETVIIFLQAAGTDDQPSANHKSPSVSNSRSSNSMMSHPSSDCFPLRRSRKHIPYRNSLLTMILKDSLGGNCLTAMIATLSLEPENICESLSTCRFAQRVARVANFAKRNEEIDDKMLIKKLKIKVAQLETKLALILAQSESPPERHGDGFSPRDEVDCQQVIEEFLQGIIDDPVSAGISTQLRFRECLHLMKCRMLQNNIPTIKALPNDVTTRPKTYNNSTSPSSIKRPNGVSKKQDDVHVTWAETEYRISPSVDSKDSNSSLQTPVVASPKFYTPLDHLFSQGDSSQQQQTQPEPTLTLTPTPTPAQEQQQPSRGNTSKSSTKKTPSAETPKELYDDMDDIDRLLLEATSTSTPNSYKTPFERKREQKIKKLGKALSNIEEEKATQEQELELMKQDTVLDSLRMEEDGLRLKLQVADEQVADQHAYILHLKHIESEPDLLAQEALVEKQLQKRQTKFKSKLKDVQERRLGVEKELAEMSGGKGKTPLDKKNSKTFEDRYGQFKQNKGSLNTRQVFEMLKNEEKKQKKEISKVEREKTVVKTKQLELKEMATWEKLRELKQMLKMSQQHGQDGSQQPYLQPELTSTSIDSHNDHSNRHQNPLITSNPIPGPSSEHSGSISHSKQLTNDNSEKSHSEYISEYIQSVQDKINRESQTKVAGPSSNQDQGNSFKHSWTVPLLQENLESPTTPAVDAFVSSNVIPHPSGKFAVGENDRKEGLQNDKSNNNEKDDNNNSSYDFDFVKNLQTAYVDQTETSQADLFPTWSAHKFILDSATHDDNSETNSQFHSPSTNNAQGRNGAIDRPGKLDSSPSMEDIMAMLTPSTIQSSTPSRFDDDNFKLVSHKIVPPSEYINSMTEQEQFDARKMGLSSRTFESALSHMLDDPGIDTGMQNVPNLPYSVDVYENYSRKPSTSSRPYQSQTHNNRNRHRSAYHPQKKNSSSTSSSNKPSPPSRGINQDGHQRSRKKGPTATEKLDKALEEHSTWGPDLKNVSIADRLSGLFDDTPSDMLPSQNTSSQNKMYGRSSGRNAAENSTPSSLKFENGLVDLEEEEENGDLGGVVVDRSCSEDDLFFGQHTPRTAITAVKKEEGEKTFMSRVASERERVAKIRKARHSAEVIQKYWRKFKTK